MNKTAGYEQYTQNSSLGVYIILYILGELLPGLHRMPEVVTDTIIKTSPLSKLAPLKASEKTSHSTALEEV